MPKSSSPCATSRRRPKPSARSHLATPHRHGLTLASTDGDFARFQACVGQSVLHRSAAMTCMLCMLCMLCIYASYMAAVIQIGGSDPRICGPTLHTPAKQRRPDGYSSSRRSSPTTKTGQSNAGDLRGTFLQEIPRGEFLGLGAARGAAIWTKHTVVYTYRFRATQGSQKGRFKTQSGPDFKELRGMRGTYSSRLAAAKRFFRQERASFLPSGKRAKMIVSHWTPMLFARFPKAESSPAPAGETLAAAKRLEYVRAIPRNSLKSDRIGFETVPF